MEALIEKELGFQKAWDDYWHTDTKRHPETFYKKAMDDMWMYVRDACFNIAKKLVSGLKNTHGKPIQVQDLDGKVLDATIKIMDKVRNGFRPHRLSSYCYLWVYGAVFGNKERKWDTAISFDSEDSTFANYAFVMEDDVYTICRGNF